MKNCFSKNYIDIEIYGTDLSGDYLNMNDIILVKRNPFQPSLTLFKPMPHFNTPCKRQKTFGFSGGIEMKHWHEKGQFFVKVTHFLREIKLKTPRL